MKEKRLTGVALGETGSAEVAQWLTGVALGESRSAVVAQLLTAVALGESRRVEAASTADLGRRCAVCCSFVCLLVCSFDCLLYNSSKSTHLISCHVVKA